MTVLKRTPIRSKRTKPRPGRLAGAALTDLRLACYTRDGGKCVTCGRPLLYKHHFTAHPDRYHMAHIGNKRMWGDNLDNVLSKCSGCHLVGDHNPKPCPPKPKG